MSKRSLNIIPNPFTFIGEQSSANSSSKNCNKLAANVKLCDSYSIPPETGGNQQTPISTTPQLSLKSHNNYNDLKQLYKCQRSEKLITKPSKFSSKAGF